MSDIAIRESPPPDALRAVQVAPDVAEWDVWSTRARIVVRQPELLGPAVEVARGLLDDVDRAASRFREDSEVVALERGAGPTAVSPLLAELVRASLDAAQETDGDVDPCLAGAMREIGYDRDFALLAGGSDLTRLPVVSRRPLSTRRLRTPQGHDVTVARELGWRDVRLHDGSLSVPAGLGLDLGATAKAFASDRIALAIASGLGTGVLVSLGGDIATAGPGPEGGWRIRVSDGPTQPETSIALPAGHAVATSSTLRRTWVQDGRLRHHIIDPRTGLPAQPVWRTVTVAAPTCVRANTLTTAAVVRGERAPAWLRSLGVPARMVGADGQVVTLGDWPAEARSAR
ncbi:FAD:protein FMN transferase [Nocardioides panacihumi]|uniref:FAD:protein FMN transferase n=2 Tax=Nocardioides panacihumi TaxID=400774 RepID=A0ABN2QRM3_9ACTN